MHTRRVAEEVWAKTGHQDVHLKVWEGGGRVVEEVRGSGPRLTARICISRHNDLLNQDLPT